MSFARNPSRLPRVAQPGDFSLLAKQDTEKHEMLRYGRNRSSTESRYGVLVTKVGASVDVRCKCEKAETATIT